MPALQVRDFPDDLYAELKECAKRNHRSMSQQVLAFVEAGLRDGGRSTRDMRDYDIFGPRKRCFDFEEESERHARIAKRKALFKKIRENAREFPPDFPDPVEVLRECREERDVQFEEIMRQSAGGRAS